MAEFFSRGDRRARDVDLNEIIKFLKRGWKEWRSQQALKRTANNQITYMVLNKAEDIRKVIDTLAQNDGRATIFWNNWFDHPYEIFAFRCCTMERAEGNMKDLMSGLWWHCNCCP
jgi:hypothetical protein